MLLRSAPWVDAPFRRRDARELAHQLRHVDYKRRGDAPALAVELHRVDTCVAAWRWGCQSRTLRAGTDAFLPRPPAPVRAASPPLCAACCCAAHGSRLRTWPRDPFAGLGDLGVGLGVVPRGAQRLGLGTHPTARRIAEQVIYHVQTSRPKARSQLGSLSIESPTESEPCLHLAGERCQGWISAQVPPPQSNRQWTKTSKCHENFRSQPAIHSRDRTAARLIFCPPTGWRCGGP